ncbi:cupin domain-containing protein [Sporosarcina ureilytica]|uniref:Cupin type-1 domain-containing protein n=1 Tax=Sporosarcina ureilytica TaxID=298596 RepID=A0A1D8JFM2_9BACL|nr:cupin domain-containing protein [Sporosarcina ureilytica]AOV07488.1 hypothetical protein BI350_08025 [Sporosarcina ureilytica]
MLEGKAKVVHGNMQESVEPDKGDFIYIPPFFIFSFENNNQSENLVFVTFMASSFQIKYEDSNPIEEAGNNQAKVVRATELDESTNQTKNMPRRIGIQSNKIWMNVLPVKLEWTQGHIIMEKLKQVVLL